MSSVPGPFRRARADRHTAQRQSPRGALAARYAAHLIGCPVAHLYNRLSADAQAAIVRDVETRALVVGPSYAARAAEVTALAPVPHVLTLGAGGTGTDLLESAAAEPAEPISGLARPEPGEDEAARPRQLLPTPLAHAAGLGLRAE
ncbi:hypothetical protein ACFV1R_07855 [Streptomyces coelicoflavus]|uniref:hypothetical protein n=1 Tax=Streptomyces coelicoflavus TaxID=285562 RepID=UPI0036B80D14